MSLRAQREFSNARTPSPLIGRQTRGRAQVSDLVIGIDFGTTYTGVAYAHSLSGITDNLTNRPQTQSELSEITEKVFVVKQWPGVEQFFEKTPTMLTYKQGKVTWGGRAKALDDGIKIQYFKLGLQEGAREHYRSNTANESSTSLLGGFLDNHNWRHPDLANRSAVDYVEDFLRELKEHVLKEELPRRMPREFLQNEHISYAITVPAIWNDKARDLTKQAAKRAGIPEDGLVIISEPEAAALYCAITCGGISFKPGDRFVVCDAGGGTVVNSTPSSMLMW